ncbi:hypothetical protein pb186bvf_005676 [Paramecium bursaria]
MWTRQEDQILIRKHIDKGKKWTLIQTYLPNKSTASIKSRIQMLTKWGIIDQQGIQIVRPDDAFYDERNKKKRKERFVVPMMELEEEEFEQMEFEKISQLPYIPMPPPNQWSDQLQRILIYCYREYDGDWALIHYHFPGKKLDFLKEKMNIEIQRQKNQVQNEWIDSSEISEDDDIIIQDSDDDQPTDIVKMSSHQLNNVVKDLLSKSNTHETLTKIYELIVNHLV